MAKKVCRIYQDINNVWTVLWYPSKERGALPKSFCYSTKNEAIARAKDAGLTHAKFGVVSNIPVKL